LVDTIALYSPGGCIDVGIALDLPGESLRGSSVRLGDVFFDPGAICATNIRNEGTCEPKRGKEKMDEHYQAL
jgi:hypothetical protein